MKILFLHPNFPAQFKAPCIGLAQTNRHDVKFICQTHFGRSINGVEKLVLKGSGSHENTLLAGKNEHERILFRAKAYRTSFLTLNNQNWQPDVVVAHSGWGCGLHVKEIWPRTHFISYLEWWFDAKSDLIASLKQNEYYKLNEKAIQKLWNRNIPTAFEMSVSDKIITPTNWQKQQLPPLLRNICEVVPDQIDKAMFFPEPTKISKRPLLTYGTRGMEPMRGFPQFIKAIPYLLRKWPQLKIEIAGSDTVSYGGNLPKEKSWQKWASNFLSSEGLSDRVEWLGQMPLKKYSNWLKKTWCHVYLSEPFVTSWSFIEAMHCEIPLVVSDTKATLEFEHINQNISKIDHNNQEELLAAINAQIRFRGNFKRNNPGDARLPQIEKALLRQSSTRNLASLIADVEATTKI
tara:strand:+ start:6379 stop:7593 length:1215 start_codon:yes stop_codon:yes gene_type:complete